MMRTWTLLLQRKQFDVYHNDASCPLDEIIIEALDNLVGDGGWEPL